MRDVSKILTDADLVKLRALIAQHPDIPTTEGEPFKEYPKMLFAPQWVELYRLMKDHPDHLVRKEAQEKIKLCEQIVYDLETEEEYLLDGWKADPNDLIVAANIAENRAHPDPRVPTGREGRRAQHQTKMSRERELADLRRRYAELTGRRLLDEPTMDVEAAQPEAPFDPGTGRDQELGERISQGVRVSRRAAQPPVETAAAKRARVKSASSRAVQARA